MTEPAMSPELARFFDAMRPFLSGEEPLGRFVERVGPSPSGHGRLAVYPRLVAFDWITVLDKLYEATRHAIERHHAGTWPRLRTELGRAHPPEHWDINDYGRPFPEWIAKKRESGANLPPFVDQLADFEWLEFATWSAKDEPDDASLAAPTTAGPLSPNGERAGVRGTARPIVEPTVSVRQYAYAVPAYARAVRRGEDPPPPAEKATTVVVYRRPDTLLVHLFYPSVAGLLVLAHAAGEVDEATLAKAGVTPDLRKTAEVTLREHKILRAL